MKKRLSVLIFYIVFIFLPVSLSVGADPKDPDQIFYRANSRYETGDYDGAIREYTLICDMGLESGNLYYNIGNAFFKKSEIGLAILWYERAKRILPQDSDLKSNLSYAQSLVENGYNVPQRNMVLKIIELPFEGLNRNSLTVLTLAFYLAVICLLVISTLNRPLAKKIFVMTIVIVCLFLYSLSAFVNRFYNTEILKHGIVIEKRAECKYEPIDKSTTYFTLGEGNEVIVLKARNGWCRIKRLDGKVAWVKKEAVEII